MRTKRLVRPRGWPFLDTTSTAQTAFHEITNVIEKTTLSARKALSRRSGENTNMPIRPMSSATHTPHVVNAYSQNGCTPSPRTQPMLGTLKGCNESTAKICLTDSGQARSRVPMMLIN